MPKGVLFVTASFYTHIHVSFRIFICVEVVEKVAYRYLETEGRLRGKKIQRKYRENNSCRELRASYGKNEKAKKFKTFLYLFKWLFKRQTFYFFFFLLHSRFLFSFALILVIVRREQVDVNSFSQISAIKDYKLIEKREQIVDR